MPLFPVGGLIRGDVVVPSDGTLGAWSLDPLGSYVTGQSPAAGTVALSRIAVPRTMLVSNITIAVATAGGAAATALNCFVGLYDVTGATRLAVSVDQQASWSSVGVKTIALVTPVTVAAGAVLGALLVGTQFTTTACNFAASSASQGATANAGFGFRCGLGPTAQTALPASVTPATGTRAYFMGLS